MFSNLIYLLYFAGFQCCAACLHQNKTGGVSLKIWPSANMFALVFKVELLCTFLRPSVFDKFSRTCLTLLPETWFKGRDTTLTYYIVPELAARYYVLLQLLILL